MSAMTAEAKTFNNHISFERGLWKYQTTTFKDVPKRSVFGTTSGRLGARNEARTSRNGRYVANVGVELSGMPRVEVPSDFAPPRPSIPLVWAYCFLYLPNYTFNLCEVVN